MALVELRQPRLRVFINDTEIQGIISGDVLLPDSFRAGRFRFSAAVTGAAWWTSPPLLAELRVTLDGIDYAQITGYVDDISYDAVRGIVEANGRDLAALPIGRLTPTAYENQAADEIAAALAAQYGFTLSLQGDDSLYGRVFQSTTSAAVFSGYHNVQSDWDLLCGLARNQDCGIWMDGWVLNIAPPAAAAPVVAMTPADCVALHCTQRLDLTAGIEVIVQSWDSWGETMVSETSATGAGGAAGRSMRVTVPNLQQAAAGKLAVQLQRSLADHLMTVDVVMPGEVQLAPRANFLLSGTNSPFDGVYAVREISRSLSAQGGFQQSIQASAVTWTL